MGTLKKSVAKRGWILHKYFLLDGRKGEEEDNTF